MGLVSITWLHQMSVAGLDLPRDLLLKPLEVYLESHEVANDESELDKGEHNDQDVESKLIWVQI